MLLYAILSSSSFPLRSLADWVTLHRTDSALFNTDLALSEYSEIVPLLFWRHCMANPRNEPHGRTALVLYGSETGSAKDVAEELGRICERLRFETQVAEMNDIDVVCHVPDQLWCSFRTDQGYLIETITSSRYRNLCHLHDWTG